MTLKAPVRRPRKDGRAATLANLFGSTICAPALRFVMDRGEVPAVDLMFEFHRLGGKATGYTYAFRRFESPAGGSLIRRTWTTRNMTRRSILWIGPAREAWIESMTSSELREAVMQIERESIMPRRFGSSQTDDDIARASLASWFHDLKARWLAVMTAEELSDARGWYEAIMFLTNGDGAAEDRAVAWIRDIDAVGHGRSTATTRTS